MAPYTFSLFAPYNKHCALRLKNANTRMFGIDILMDKDEESGYFRKTVDLADGQYHYQFKIQTNSWFEQPTKSVPSVVDGETPPIPNATEVDKQTNVQNNETPETFTEIIYVLVDPYATDIEKHGTDDAHKSVGVINIKDGQKITDEYEWKHDKNDRFVPDDELIMYEIHVGDFRQTFQDITAKIEHFKKLGINAIQLMPVNQYAGLHSWGYNMRYSFAVEHVYGTSRQFKEMIDQLHAEGIRVLIDGVYNHTECSSPLTQIDHDYWFHHEPKERAMSWGPEWDYDKYDPKFQIWPARKFVSEAIRYHVQEFHVDGLRFDSAKQIRNFEYIASIVQDSKSIANKPFYTVAEYLPDNPEITMEKGGPCDGTWHDSFYWLLKRALMSGGVDIEYENLKSIIDCRKQGYATSKNVVNYISNHDHDRLLVELGKEKHLFGEEAFHLIRLAVVVLVTSIGNILIWMGEEFGESQEKLSHEAKLQWQLIENNEYEFNHRMFDYWCTMIRLRHEHKLSLKSDNLEFFHDDPQNQIFAYYRYNNDRTDHVLVIINWSNQSFTNYRVNNAPVKGQWTEWLSKAVVTVDGDQTFSFTLDLGPQEGKVLTLNEQI